MLNRKNLAVSLVVVLLLTMLAGCTMGEAAGWPDRDVEINLDTALAAQDAGIAGLMMGNLQWTESEFSSFLTELVKQNAGEANVVESITAWFEPGNQVYLRVELMPGTVPFGNTLDLAGTVDVQDTFVHVDLSDAGIGGVRVSGPMLDVVTGAINRALADPSLGVAVDVETGDGTLGVTVGGM